MQALQAFVKRCLACTLMHILIGIVDTQFTFVAKSVCLHIFDAKLTPCTFLAQITVHAQHTFW